MSRMHSCRECLSPLVDDYQSGEIVCSRCGVVAHDQIPDSGPEAGGSFSEERTKLARATGQATFTQHDLGISTDIDASSRDFSGKPINRTVMAHMNNLRRWQQRVRVSGSRERRVANILIKIGNACNALSLPKNVVETSSMIYRSLDERVDLKGKSVTGMSAAVIYMACKQCGVIRSIEEITGGLCQPREVRAKSKLAARYYRSLVMEVGSSRSTLMPMEKYISKISNISETDVRVERLALRLAGKTRNHEIVDGKDPNGVAAAYLYIASILLGHDTIQRDISGTAGVTEVTIRNRCKEILGAYDIRITLKPSAPRR